MIARATPLRASVAVAAVIAVAVAIVSCNTPAATDAAPETPGASPDSSMSAPTPSLEAIPSIDAAVIVRPELTCGDDLTFQPAALFQQRNDELADDIQAEALRSFLTSPDAPEEPTFPLSGWSRVADLPDRVQFITRAVGADEWVVAGFALVGGEWTLDLAGFCEPEVILPEGLNRADWWLDPDEPSPGPDARTLDVLVLERACANGQSSDGRIVPPAVVYTPEAVVMTFGVRSLGAADCPGHEPGRFTVELAEPLADRALLDGGVFPLRDARQPPENT